MYSPGYSEPAIPMVSTFSPWGYAYGSLATFQFPASVFFESANRAVFQPVFIRTPCVARRVWWQNGSSVSASYNLSVAVYAATPQGEPGAKIIECASTAQGTASQVQFVDITDTYLPAGLTWIAVAASSASATLYGNGTTPTASYDAIVRFQQSGITVGSLPATATPAESSSTYTYLFGFATTASP